MTLVKYLRCHPLPTYKWACLVATVTSCFLGGSMYVMGVWALQLKQLMDYNQVHINIITSLFFGGGCIGLLPVNFLFQYCRKYTWFTGLLALIVGTLGYGTFAIAAHQKIEHHDDASPFFTSWRTLTVASAFAGINVMALFVMGLQSSLSHLPEKQHQLFQMINQAFYALGNIAWPLIYRAFLSDLSKLFTTFTFVTFFNGVFFFLCVAPATNKLNSHEDEGEEESDLGGDTNNNNINTLSQEQERAKTPSGSDESSGLLRAAEQKQQQQQQHRTTTEQIKDISGLEFFVAAAVYFIAFGLTVNVFSNGGSMASAVSSPPSSSSSSASTSTTFELESTHHPVLHDLFYVVSLYGCAQMIGRLICIGWSYKHRERPYALICFAFVILFVLFFTAMFVNTETSVDVYFLIVGVCYGICWSSFSGVFMKIAKLRCPDDGAISTAISLATFLSPGFGPPFVNYISGYIYDKHGVQDSEGEITCTGTDCYHGTFVVSTVLAGMGLLASIALCIHDLRRKK